jgi:integrase
MVRYDDTGDEGHVYLTPGQVDQLCSGMDGPTATIVRLLVGTGCRWSEITAVPVSSVDLLARTPVMRITRAWKRDGCARWYLGTTKGRQKRTLTLGAALVDLLATLVAGEPGDAMIAALAMRRMGKPYVVREKGGERLDYDAWRSRRWEPAVRAMMTCSEHPPEKGQKASTCECPTRLRNRPTIHDLRHTHAAWLISAGVPLPAVQRRLGHQNITTTIETYGGLMPEVDTALVAAIDQAMGVTAQVNGLI